MVLHVWPGNVEGVYHCQQGQVIPAGDGEARAAGPKSRALREWNLNGGSVGRCGPGSGQASTTSGVTAKPHAVSTVRSMCDQRWGETGEDPALGRALGPTATASNRACFGSFVRVSNGVVVRQPPGYRDPPGTDCIGLQGGFGRPPSALISNVTATEVTDKTRVAGNLLKN